MLRWAVAASSLWASAAPCAHADDRTSVPEASAMPLAGDAPPVSPAARPCTRGRVVALTFAANVSPSLARETHTDLATELRGRAIEVCTQVTSTDAAIVAQVHVRESGPEQLSIELRDPHTHERITRPVSLARLPESGKPLAIAIAIDELLRARWAEQTIGPHARDDHEADSHDVAQRTDHARSSERMWIALHGRYAGTLGRFDAFGSTLSLDVLPWRALWVDVRIGVSRALTRDVGPGSVSILGVSSGATLGACLDARGQWLRSCFGAGAELEVLSLTSDADPDVEGRDQVQPLVSAQGVGALLLRVGGPVVLMTTASIGATLSGVRITDEDETLLRIEGLLLSASLGVGVTL